MLLSIGCQGGKHHVSFKEWTTVAFQDVKKSFDPTIRAERSTMSPWAQYRNDRQLGIILPLHMYGIDEAKYEADRLFNPNNRKYMWDPDLLIWRPKGVNEGYIP